MSVSFQLKLAVQWASRNLHRFDRRWKKCEREMWRSWRRNAEEASRDKRCPLKATAVWCYLCFPLTSSADLTSRLCPSSVHLFLSRFFFTFCRLCIFFKKTSCLPLMTSFFIPSPSFSPPFLSHPINSSDTVSHWCSHYIAQGASPLHLPVMDFQCFDRLTCHVVMSPCWVASLCKLFRNAWILSVLLYSFYHHSLPRQSSKAWPHTSLLPLHRIKLMKRLITRLAGFKSYLKLSYNAGMYCKAAQKAHHCFNHHLLGGKWSART